MLYYHLVFHCACVAQLAEQLTRNEQVAGSNPATSSKKDVRKGVFFLSLSGRTSFFKLVRSRSLSPVGGNPATSSRLLADDARSFSMCKSDDKRYTLPMKNAEASVRMEGCQVTPQMREQCQRVLRGEVTTADLLRQILGEAIK